MNVSLLKGSERAVTFLCVTASVLLATRASSAQAQSDAAPTAVSSTGDAEARAHELARDEYRRGVRFVENGDQWQQALGAFERSRAHYDTPNARLNIALCLKNLGRYVEAISEVDALLDKYGGSLSNPLRGLVLKLREEASKHTGQLLLAVQPIGATLILNGEERGVLPLPGSLRLDSGTHLIRLQKDGFEPSDHPVTVAGGEFERISIHLRALRGKATLSVVEKSGLRLDVLVDSAVVGQTPWKGSVSTGRHSIVLRGQNIGTAPIAVEIAPNGIVPLQLEAIPLDSSVSVRPQPAWSVVFIDGVFASHGAWAGALPSGDHDFDIVAPGFEPYRRKLTLTRYNAQTLHAKLTPDLPLGIYLEPQVGLVLAQTLRGSIDEACDCADRARPFGFSATARFGYHLSDPWAVEFTAGYLQVSEASTRTVRFRSEPGTFGFHADDFRETLDLSGPTAMVSGSARFFETFPLTARIGVGVALLTAYTSQRGTAEGYIADRGGEPDQAIDDQFSASQTALRLLVKTASAEIRWGYAFTPRVSVDLGVAAVLMIPPDSRIGEQRYLTSTAEKTNAIGQLWLKGRSLVRSTMMVLPSVATRVEF